MNAQYKKKAISDQPSRRERPKNKITIRMNFSASSSVRKTSCYAYNGRCHAKFRTYTQREWDDRREVVAVYYKEERHTLEELRNHLCSLGFHVNIRMIKGRVSRWKLEKKHNLAEMRAAVYLLGPNKALWPSQQPQFLIKDRVVTYDDVVHYFKRKGLNGWDEICAEHLDDSFELSPDVKLIAEEDEEDDMEDEEESSDDNSQYPGPNLLVDHPHENAEVDTPSSVQTPNTVIEEEPIELPYHGDLAQVRALEQRVLALPAVFRPSAGVHWNMLSYCSEYLDSMRGLPHVEPIVHKDTVHGRFGDRMQHGMALLKMGDQAAAFDSLDSAFNLIADMLKDDHPMSLAQYMAIVCELVAKDIPGVLHRLFQCTQERARKCLPPSHPIHGMLNEFVSAGTGADAERQASHLAVNSMRTALGCFESRGALAGWKSLYLKERLCDCLYHAHNFGEGSQVRAKLLEEQEVYYGSRKRNVLWTLTNVADDLMTQMRLPEAEEKYTEALRRAESLEGFGRAKIRFAALEGLARTARLKGEEKRRRWRNGLFVQWTGEGDPGAKEMADACRMLAEAEIEAKTWFGEDSRRTLRVRVERLEIETAMCEWVA